MSKDDDGQQDLFEEQTSATATAEADIKTETHAAEADEGEVKEAQTGEEENSPESPSGEQEDTEGSEAATSGKMIPEHRFKAALKDVTDKLELAQQKIATYEATPIPDKETDPEGYNLHVRMEASKQVMREMKPDYNEVITHYKKMADANPRLNEDVAAHPLPAKFAYDLAKKDMKIRELEALEGSNDWKEFQEFKKMKAANKTTEEVEEVGNKKATGAPKVPNLNKATNVNKSNSKIQTDDELFAGAL